MSMVTPESIKLIETIINGKQGDFVSMDKIVLRGIITELKMLQAGQTKEEAARYDMIQKLSLEMSFNGVADMLETAAPHYPDLSNMLLKLAKTFREKAVNMIPAQGVVQ